MWRSRTLLALALSLSFLTLSSQATVFDKDNRESWDPEAEDTRFVAAVGMIAVKQDDGKYKLRCTGTLLSSNLVLTTESCLIDFSTSQPYQANELVFQVNSQGVLPNKMAYSVVNNIVWITNDPLVKHGWALLILDQSITSLPNGFVFPKLSDVPLDFSDGAISKVLIAGYSIDPENVDSGNEFSFSIDRDCSLKGRDLWKVKGLIAHSCDVTHGVSEGSPIFKDGKIVAINLFEDLIRKRDGSIVQRPIGTRYKDEISNSAIPVDLLSKVAEQLSSQKKN